MFERLWKFDTARFSVVLEAEPEAFPDLSWDETGETAENLASGLWQCVTFRVRVLMDGREIGADYLGQSIYENLQDFRHEHFGLAAKSRADGVIYGSYFPDMVRLAIAEARSALCNAPRMRCAA